MKLKLMDWRRRDPPQVRPQFGRMLDDPRAREGIAPRSVLADTRWDECQQLHDHRWDMHCGDEPCSDQSCTVTVAFTPPLAGPVGNKTAVSLADTCYRPRSACGTGHPDDTGLREPERCDLECRTRRHGQQHRNCHAEPGWQPGAADGCQRTSDERSDEVHRQQRELLHIVRPAWPCSDR